jgi:hypothetical protein
MKEYIPLSTEGRLFVYQMQHPSDHTKHGETITFRDSDKDSADVRAIKKSKQYGCTVVYIATL